MFTNKERIRRATEVFIKMADSAEIHAAFPHMFINVTGAEGQ